MPTLKSKDYYQLFLSYLNGEKILTPQHEKVTITANSTPTQKAKLLYETILIDWESFNLQKKLDIISKISEAIAKANVKRSKEKGHRLKLFKLLFGQTNWKDALLGVKPQYAIKLYANSFCYEHSSVKPIQFGDNNRFSIFNDDKLRTAAFIGKSFLTNRPSILKRQKTENGQQQPEITLDSLYIGSLNTKEKQNDFLVGIADGSGGHFGDERQDIAISRAAKFGVKHALRIMSCYSSPAILKEQLEDLVSPIAEQIKSKTSPFKEGATLIAMRAYNNGESYRCVGFNIGDSMLLAWDPEQQKIITLSPARLAIYDNGQEATAIMPTAFKPYEIHTFDIKLSNGVILLPISDGIYDYLPLIQKTKKYSNGNRYKETIIDSERLTPIVIKHANNHLSPNGLVQAIAKYAISSLEAKRKQQQQFYNKNKVKIESLQSTISGLEKKLTKLDNQNESKTEKSKVEDEQQLDEARIKLEELLNKTQIQLGDDVTIGALELQPAEEKGCSIC